jgi:hypothetical protein
MSTYCSIENEAIAVIKKSGRIILSNCSVIASIALVNSTETIVMTTSLADRKKLGVKKKRRKQNKSCRAIDAKVPSKVFL